MIFCATESSNPVEFYRDLPVMSPSPLSFSRALKVRKSLLGKMKLFLPVLALITLLLSLIWPQLRDLFQEKTPPAKIALPEAATTTAQYNSVTNPQFDTVDQAGRPFRIQAKEGIEKESGKLEFKNPAVTLSEQGGEAFSVTAATGLWNRHNKDLDLKGNVTLNHPSGMHLQSESIYVDLKTGSASSKTLLKGTGPLGTVEAQGFQYDGKEQRLLLVGRPKITFSINNEGEK